MVQEKLNEKSICIYDVFNQTELNEAQNTNYVTHRVDKRGRIYDISQTNDINKGSFLYTDLNYANQGGGFIIKGEIVNNQVYGFFISKTDTRCYLSFFFEQFNIDDKNFNHISQKEIKSIFLNLTYNEMQTWLQIEPKLDKDQPVPGYYKRGLKLMI
jgi:hypothetical protein